MYDDLHTMYFTQIQWHNVDDDEDWMFNSFSIHNEQQINEQKYFIIDNIEYIE